MANLNRTCCLCGTKYSYCPSCTTDRNKPSWMTVFCSENCRNIYNTTTKYGMKKISAVEAKKDLDVCGLSNKEQFNAHAKKMLDEIYAESSVSKSKAAESVVCVPEVNNIKPTETFVYDSENKPQSVVVAPVIKTGTSAEGPIVVRNANYRRKKRNR